MSVSNTKSYFVGPEDGWVAILDSTTTNMTYLRLSAVPHSAPFLLYSGPTAPTATSTGVLSCHRPLELYNNGSNNASKFYVKVPTSVNGSQRGDGKLRIDVYADGGVLQ